MERKWISAKSSIALGSFVFFFAINQFFIHRSTVSLIVGIVFLFVGAGSIWGGYRAHRYYFPLAVKEAEELK